MGSQKLASLVVCTLQLNNQKVFNEAQMVLIQDYEKRTVVFCLNSEKVYLIPDSDVFSIAIY